MPGPLELILWFLCTPLEVAVLVCAYRKGALKKYFFLNLYMAASLLSSLLRYRVLHSYGLNSKGYFYVYFYSDALLTICLFFALTSLFSRVFSEMKAEKYVQIGAALLLILTALFSYSVVRQSATSMEQAPTISVTIAHVALGLSQNLYFVGLVLTYLLWGAILKMRETRTRLVQLVLSMGVYFSLFAATYALNNLRPQWSSTLEYFPPLIACFLPLAWAYAFWRLPEDARLTPSRLAVP